MKDESEILSKEVHIVENDPFHPPDEKLSKSTVRPAVSTVYKYVLILLVAASLSPKIQRHNVWLGLFAPLYCMYSMYSN
jgi:hypothetical protein